MTSSPEPLAAWSPPDLEASPVTVRAAARAAAAAAAAVASHASIAHEESRPALAALGDRAAEAIAPAAWALPDLDAWQANSAREEPARSPEDEAFALGLAEGSSRAEARAGEQIRPVLEAMFELMEQVEASRASFEHDRERNLRGLALAVAHQLLQREVASDPGVVRDLVAKALELMPANVALEVRMNPCDLQALAGEIERLAGGGRAIPVQWLADPTLQRGGFMIESPLRLVDGRADIALRALFDRLEHA